MLTYVVRVSCTLRTGVRRWYYYKKRKKRYIQGKRTAAAAARKNGRNFIIVLGSILAVKWLAI